MWLWGTGHGNSSRCLVLCSVLPSGAQQQWSSLLCQQFSGEAAARVSNQKRCGVAICLARRSLSHRASVRSVCGFPRIPQAPAGDIHGQSHPLSAGLLGHCQEDDKGIFPLSNMARLPLVRGQGERMDPGDRAQRRSFPRTPALSFVLNSGFSVPAQCFVLPARLRGIPCLLHHIP